MLTTACACDTQSRFFKSNPTPSCVAAPARPDACISVACGLAWHVVGGFKRAGFLLCERHRTQYHPVPRSVSITVPALFVWCRGTVATAVASRLADLPPGQSERAVVAWCCPYPGSDALVHRIATDWAGRHDGDWFHWPHFHHDRCGLVSGREDARRPLGCGNDRLCRGTGGGRSPIHR